MFIAPPHLAAERRLLCSRDSRRRRGRTPGALKGRGPPAENLGATDTRAGEAGAPEEGPMATCASCGKEMRDDDWTCGNCGAPVNEAGAAGGAGASSSGYASGYESPPAAYGRRRPTSRACGLRRAGRARGGEERPVAHHAHHHHRGGAGRRRHHRRLVLRRPRHRRHRPRSSAPGTRRAAARERRRRDHAEERRLQGDDDRQGRGRRGEDVHGPRAPRRRRAS